MGETCPLNQALVIFEDNLADIRAACVANAEDVIATYSPYKELGVDQPITKQAIHEHINFLRVQEKLKPILHSIKRIDAYRYYKNNPHPVDLVTDQDIQRAREVDESWFIREANLCTSKPSKGRCPFHPDQDPSLMLMRSKAKGTLYLKCFVCAESWDSIAYVRKRDNVGFIQAVKIINGV